MQHFKVEGPKIEGPVASFAAISDSHCVTITVERKDRKAITESDARLTYSEALQLFPTMKRYGP